MTLEDLRRTLATRERHDFPFHEIPAEALPERGLARAAVLVPLLERNGEVHVLLTKRRSHLRHHAGQWSFPGGRMEHGESTLDAALREAREEIGVDPALVDVLGRLDETLVLASGFRLTPWVGRVPYPYPYTPHPDEVEALIVVSLAELSVEGAHRTEVHAAYGMSHQVHFYDVGGEVVWGATARILNKLLAIWKP